MEFKVHEKVRVRDWDEMIEEFGACLGVINTPHIVFISEMRKFCGETYEIREIIGYSDYIVMILEGLETLHKTYFSHRIWSKKLKERKIKAHFHQTIGIH